MKKAAILFRLLTLIAVMTGVRQASGQIQIWNPDHQIGTANHVYNYSYTQTPAQLIEVYAAAIPNTGLTYQWWYSTSPTTGFQQITGANQSSYSPPALTTTSVTTYYYRVTSSTTAMPLNGVLTTSITSNTIKIKVVSVNWEDINYVREHNVQNIGQSTWTGIDQLPIGAKLQTTTYFDGLGRPTQQVSKQTATPASGSSTWGDQVKFSIYDQYNRQPLSYLPYTTTNQAGSFKTTAVPDQAAYYANTATYNQSSPYKSITFDNSPLNRVVNVKESGAAWAASAGNGVVYDMNTVADSVQIWNTDYVQGDAPVNNGMYPVNTLYKNTFTDVNGNQVIQFTDQAGHLILKKVQSTAAQVAGYGGWICIYNVYDDFGLLRFEIQPMGVQYLDGNGWTFTGTNGPMVFAEQVFQYNFDDKGRTVWKKAPGAAPLNMVYDSRDRLVYMQDGNQAALSTPQWTANLYDPLDRVVAATLFNTTVPLSGLQSDVTNAPATTSLTITNTANTGGSSITLNLSLCPASLNSTSLNSSTSTTVLKYNFYDNYSFSGAAAFFTGYTNLTAYSTSDPNVLPIATTSRVLSIPTGKFVRVLGSASTFLESTSFFDEKGQHIQSSDYHLRNSTDILTLQYRWDGRLLSNCNVHSNQPGGYSGFITLTKYIFDNIGRIDSIQKTYASNAMKTMASYQYDDQGRLATKNLDPAYTNINSGTSGLESLNYSYNLHSQITAINKDYALKNASDYNKWGHFFGEYLGYDNTDNIFSHAQLDGQVTGKVWNTQGDDAQRRYDYTYDNARRLTIAIYQETQTANSGYSNAVMDFKVSGHAGQATYDLNGNLLTMQQRGVIPGMTPLVIDDLFYGYNSFSNKLSSISDQMSNSAVNGLCGDFKDGTNGSIPDYVFDANGNQVIDLNKNIQSLNNGNPGTNGVHYNFLDKPDQIRLVGQGTIDIVYSADGEKLQRTFIPEATGALSTVTTYIGDFVYQARGSLSLSATIPYSVGTADTLNYVDFEEGRIRVMTPFTGSNGYDGVTEAGNLTLPQSTTSGVWDYFVRDYQQNVRMVLTEESHNAVNRCTMETNRAAAEDPVFGQTGSGNEVEVTRVSMPSGWTNNSSASCSQLGNLAGHTIGPNDLQKVMAGDLINTSVLYYYAGSSTSSNPNIIPTILTSLASAISGPASTGTLVHGEASAITTNLGNNSAFINAVEPSNSTSGTPQAYLTVLFFDERFNPVPAANGGVLQLQVASSWTTSTPALGWNNIKVPKNGYVYIYVSNRSDQSVYFDNLAVSITAGNIAEEEHYYPFGLKIASISSRRLGDANEGTIKNNNLYNDKELFDDGGLNWYDYGFRNYDPQIGRFPQLDPLAFGFGVLTPFQFAGNDPIANVDLDGLEPQEVISFAKSIGAGAEGIRPVTEGAFKGGWFVTLGGYGRYFKAVQPAANATKGIISAALKWQLYLQLVAVRGGADAARHNNSFGLVGGDNGDDYVTNEEKAAYYRGRIGGDIGSQVTGSYEIAAGGTGALTTGATGVGLAVSGAIALHGVAVDAIASYDMHSSLQKLYNLDNTSESGSSGSSSSENSPEPLKYKASPKHVEGRGWGSDMDLSDAEAEQVLKNSDQIGRERWGFKDGKLYNFKSDNAGTWHGYRVETAPTQYLRKLKENNIITNAQYKKFLKASD